MLYSPKSLYEAQLIQKSVQIHAASVAIVVLGAWLANRYLIRIDQQFAMTYSDSKFIHHNNAVANQWLGRSHVLSNETKLVLVTDEKSLFFSYSARLPSQLHTELFSTALITVVTPVFLVETLKMTQYLRLQQPSAASAYFREIL